MSDLQAIADRFEIEALRAEFTDAVMMRDYDRITKAADGFSQSVDVELVALGILHRDSVVVEPFFAEYANV